MIVREELGTNLLYRLEAQISITYALIFHWKYIAFTVLMVSSGVMVDVCTRFDVT
jgi:hypothetical protein